MMKIRFWGVRGSIPCPGPSTQKYGGNSACIELRVGEDERLIIMTQVRASVISAATS